jgi:tripartite ATP-independent transporter DctM subunit
MKPLYHTAGRIVRLTENTVAVIVLSCLSLIPVMEIIARTFFKTGVYGSADYVQHLVLWITFVGGMFASREKRHLSLAAGVDSLPLKFQTWVKTLTSFISVAVVSGLAIASYNFIRLGLDTSLSVGIFKTQYVAFIMPLGFAIMAIRFVNYAPKGAAGAYKLAACAGVVVPVLFATALASSVPALVWPLAVFLALSLAAGTPIFVVLGGLAQLFILKNTGETATLANEAYTMLTGPTIATIPLFSLAGYLLSESKAGERLVRLFQAVFGWMPGGLTIMAIMVSAFFTTFTGASGVTVIALGGLLSYILIQSGYKREFSVGFITSCGSLGLLFPPSLAVILYGVVSHVNIRHLFVAGLLPGLFIVTIMAVLGMAKSRKYKIKPVPFRAKEAALSLKESMWEILLPIIILVGFFKGIFTLVEMSAITVLYVVIVEVVIKKDIKIRDLPRALLTCVPMVGGVLVILAVAKGLSYCIIDAEIPMTISQWAQAHIHSKYVFLLLLNGALLVVGCFMDIFSAIIVIVPLIAPLGTAFGVAPVHLAVIFLTNLEIGYLMPPVGINLQLGSYRFNENMARMYRYIFPFVIALFAAVLAITYLPFLSTWLVGALFG